MSDKVEQSSQSVDDQLKDIFKIYEDLFPVKPESRQQLIQSVRNTALKQPAGRGQKRVFTRPIHPG